MNSIDVSVIVTTRNEEKNIQNCLESVKKQTYFQDKIEIIIVDNNSEDKTKDIALNYTHKVYNLGPERSAQRNYGVKHAEGAYILYLDADMTLSTNVILEAVEKCEKEGCSALYIPERIIGDGFWMKVRDFERSFYNATCIDAVRFVRKDKFVAIGGFDETLTGPEDWDFDRRINAIGKSGIAKSPLYHNENGFNLQNYIKKKSYYVQHFNTYIDKWGKNDPVIKKQLGFGYRYCGVFFEKGNILRIALHPFLTLGMYSLRLLVGLAYSISNKHKKGAILNKKELT